MHHTPYDNLMRPELNRQLIRENPYAVCGDIAVRKHPKEKINMIWWMVSDVGMEEGDQWVPLGYAETGQMGRFIANRGPFVAYGQNTMNRYYGSIYRYDGAPDWGEVDMRIGYEHTLLFALGTLLEPRGVIPKSAFEWIVLGELLPEYKPTFDFYEAGTEMYVLLKNATLVDMYASTNHALEVCMFEEENHTTLAETTTYAQAINDAMTNKAENYYSRASSMAQKHCAMYAREKQIHPIRKKSLRGC
jgi:hypothetical protein